jgi:hypothetical protein
MAKRPEELPDLIQQVLRRAEGSYRDRSHLVWDVWEDAVGPELARRSRPQALRAGRLTVAVANAAWMQQLSFLRESIRDAVNRALGQPLVREVRLRMTEVEAPRPVHQPSAPPPWLEQPLDDPARDAVEREVSAIRDPELREAIRQTRIRAEQVRRYREAPTATRPRQSSGRRVRGDTGDS